MFGLWAGGEPLLAVGVMTFGTAALVVYGTATSVAWKYLFPGVAGMLLFVAFPLVYTVQIGFTNYSSSNLLDEARARQYLLEQSVVDEALARPFTLHADGRAFRIQLGPGEGGGELLVSPPLDLAAPPAQPVVLQPGRAAAPAADLRTVVAQRAGLQRLVLQLPDGSVVRYAGLREYGPIEPLWTARADGALVQAGSGLAFTPNRETGFFEARLPSGEVERVSPGFTVGIGWANYSRMLLDADFRGPFVGIFVWTVCSRA